MDIIFRNVVIDGLLNDFNLQFSSQGCTVLYDPCERIATTVLSALVGVTELDKGEILLDGIPREEYLKQHSLLSTFSLVFNEGIMLSNLSVHENLLLPWDKRFATEDYSAFERELQILMAELKLNCGLDLRPANLSSAQRKFFCFIRSLLLKPKIMLIDDPYYLFNKNERKMIYDFIVNHSIKNTATASSDNPNSNLANELFLQEMLIGSSDDDFTGEIATQIIDLTQSCY